MNKCINSRFFWLLAISHWPLACHRQHDLAPPRQKKLAVDSTDASVLMSKGSSCKAQKKPSAQHTKRM